MGEESPNPNMSNDGASENRRAGSEQRGLFGSVDRSSQLLKGLCFRKYSWQSSFVLKHNDICSGDGKKVNLETTIWQDKPQDKQIQTKVCRCPLKLFSGQPFSWSFEFRCFPLTPAVFWSSSFIHSCPLVFTAGTGRPTATERGSPRTPSPRRTCQVVLTLLCSHICSQTSSFTDSGFYGS